VLQFVDGHFQTTLDNDCRQRSDVPPVHPSRACNATAPATRRHDHRARRLDLIRVRHPPARGLAHGVASHGIGTVRMLDETRLAGATAAVGMGLGGAVVALVLPLLWS
jgi:LrgB-like family